jgi:CO/xanthine dehydrogenase FAD-binding subunit
MDFSVITPTTTEKLLSAIADHQGTNSKIGVGMTDLLLEIKKQPNQNLTVINLAQLNDPDFTSSAIGDNEIKIGALVTANQIANNQELQQRFPVLCQAANKLASRQIRQVATVGGNLCTASPAGDIACALVALKAHCEILSSNGTTNIIPIDDFFLDVRKTDLKPDEVLRCVIIPFHANHNLHSGFIKVGIRRSMECAVVSLAYHIHLDQDNAITHAGISIGSAAPTIKFTQSACDYLIGKKISSIGASESKAFAAKVLDYASPISDIRGSAWYRKEVLFNISKSIFES